MNALNRLGLILVLVLFSMNLSANDESRLSDCAKIVRKFYSKNAQRSDVPRGFEASHVLKAPTPLLGLQKQELAVYDEDMLVYRGSGSMHSGYFIDLIVANAQTCQPLQIFNIYSE